MHGREPDVKGRHIRRKLAWPWPEWMAWVMVAVIWTVSSVTVWAVMATVQSGSAEPTSDGKGVTITWSWPWDR